MEQAHRQAAYLQALTTATEDHDRPRFSDEIHRTFDRRIVDPVEDRAQLIQGAPIIARLRHARPLLVQGWKDTAIGRAAARSSSNHLKRFQPLFQKRV